MQDLITRCRPARVAALIAPLVAGALAGCSGLGDNPFTVFADPGKYEYYSCDQITAQRTQLSKREQELRELMNKAGQEIGGAVVNESAARSKNCETPANWRSNSTIR
jgi:hypothetical protein